MTTDIEALLIEKAKTRKDGVYSHKAVLLWAVKNGNFVAYVEWGEMFQRLHGFNVKIGSCPTWKQRSELNKLLKSL